MSGQSSLTYYHHPVPVPYSVLLQLLTLAVSVTPQVTRPGGRRSKQKSKVS